MTAHESPYGINTHVPQTEILDACRDLGVGWIRVDFDWDRIEIAKSEFDWAATDRVAEQAAERDLAIFATLSYTPEWANGAQGRNVPPQNPEDWAAFVRAAVGRYAGRVGHWGMWNEPNQSRFFSGPRSRYIEEILAVGAAAVKATDPEARVLGPDLAHLRSANWKAWLVDVLRQGGEHLDVITHHIYKSSSSRVFRTLDGLACRTWWFWESCVREVIRDAGAGDKPVWITETGWDTRRVSESSQASNYRSMVDGIRQRDWIQKVFLYEIQDEPEPGQTRFGILRADSSRKPAFEAYRSYIQENPQ